MKPTKTKVPDWVKQTEKYIWLDGYSQGHTEAIKFAKSLIGKKWR